LIIFKKTKEINKPDHSIAPQPIRSRRSGPGSPKRLSVGGTSIHPVNHMSKPTTPTKSTKQTEPTEKQDHLTFPLLFYNLFMCMALIFKMAIAGDSMGISVNLPEMNIKEDEVKLLLAIKLLEEGLVSLGKAAEIAGYSEKAFSEILIYKGVPPIKYSNLNLEKELQQA
jgi:predicted HTH domain antitoxin